MTRNAHKESCHHKLWLILRGEGIETIKTDCSGEKVVAFAITRINLLFIDKLILRYGAALFLCLLAGYLYLWY